MNITRSVGVAWAGLMAAGIAAAATSSSPLFFLPRQSHASPAVRFMVRGSGLTASFAPSEVVFRTREGVVRMEFPGASGPARIEPLEQLPGVANFLEGPEEEWQLGVPLYGGVAYRELYPGIDMIYGSDGYRLKSEFVVAPGADPSRILIRYAGAGQLRLDTDGSLMIPVGRREVREQAPVIYQEQNGTRVPVDGRFELLGDAVGFAVGAYDRAAPLVIDPTISYSTLLGGSGTNAAMALAVDAAGAAYLAGYTASYNFPTANPAQNFNAGSNDVFVAKVNPAGNALVYATYIGGSADDRAYGIAVDSTGAAYVTGSTTSANFPVRNALQAKRAGARNAFVVKLSPAGNSLVFSTYLGGNGSDTANGIALDSGGNIYVAGDTTSTAFPATAGAFQRSNRGSQDAFVAKLNPAGSALIYATYLGGSLDDHASALAVDAGGTAYVAGCAWSLDFPVASPYQSRLTGGQDAFVARIAANGAGLMFSTYLGGSGGTVGAPECANGIAFDSQGAAYVTGTTPSANFPLLNPYQSALRGWSDAFVSKFSAAGALVYSTYLGGSGLDVANSIAVDSAGNAYIAGYTSVMDLVVATPSASPGAYNAFVAALNSAGRALAMYAYIVDTGADTASSIALDSFANIYFAGWTLAPNFPVLNGIQSANTGGYSAFLTKIGMGAAVPATMTSPVPGSTLSGSSVTFQWNAGNGVSDYWLCVSKVAAGGSELWNSDEASKTSQQVTGLLADGNTVYVRLWSKFGTAWAYVDYTYKAAPPVIAAMVSPANGATLSGSSVTFQWSAGVGVGAYWLYVSKVAAGGSDIWNLGEGSSTSQTVTGLPTDGSTVYVRIWSEIGTTWLYADYTYKAANLLVAMTAPVSGSTLAAASATFQWTAGAGVSEYWLYISRVAAGGSEIYNSDEGAALSQSVANLPFDGCTVYVRLWYKLGPAWLFQDYTYKAVTLAVAIPAITAPSSSTLTSTSATFQWTAGIGVSEYWLYISKVAAGGSELYDSDEGTGLSQSVANLPSDGSTLYVRLWYKLGTAWLFQDYTYKAVASK